MSDFKITNGKLLQYIGYDSVVEIPNGVTRIGDHAFYGYSGLTSITIPNSVTSIGRGAFYRCTGLTSVTIPNSVTTIGCGAFTNCTRLASVTIGNGVTNIGDEAFFDCSRLTNVTIPNSVTSIGDGVFSRCTRLTSITIPNSLTSIEDYAFYGCSGLMNITIPNSVTSIGSHAFSECKGLTNIEMSDSVIQIGSHAFSGCKGLINIKMSDSAIYRVLKNFKQIWKNIFFGCHKHKPIENAIIAYKGFESNMTCRDFQYEEGKTYTCDNAKLCECGFHACLNPLDCFNYYFGKDSVYHEVILEDRANKVGDDSKVCGKKITIGRRLTIKEMFDIFNNLNKE